VLFDCSSPTKLVEYLALGLPVVVNDLPDQEKVVAQSGAGFCVGGEVQEFADAIVQLLRDDRLRTVMRRAGPPFVHKERSYQALGALVAETYIRILTK
jgi:glycosyltransferase involved in cell wall biosynthesis